MEEKTLREITSATGTTRRAVQGYEKAGLVHHVSKNKYGYLLYDKKGEERIKEIKFYQQMGFTLKEIKEVIDSPALRKKNALEAKVMLLRKECERLSYLILKAEELIDKLN